MTGIHLVPNTSASIVKGGIVNLKESSVRCFNFNLHETPASVVREQLYAMMASQSSENHTRWQELFKVREAPEPELKQEQEDK